jgi:hypothetical protein
MSTDTSAAATCPHWSATGEDTSEGFEKVYVCDSCGLRYRHIIDPAGEIRYADGIRARVEYLGYAPRTAGEEG